jgi:hypothetical protein
MEMYKNILLYLFILISFSAQAYRPQEGNVTANLGPYFFKTNYNDANTKTKSPLTTGFGITVNGDISTKGALEISIFHMNKRFLRSASKKYIAEMSQIVHITMGYRWWLDSYFSTSLAVFSAYPMGNVKKLYSDFPVGEEIPTSARDKTDYGFDLATQYLAWKGTEFDIVTELRYSYSLTNKSREEADHYGAFIGVRYLVQEKMADTQNSKTKVE